MGKNVHKSWPVAEIKRMRDLSMHESDFIKFRQVKIDRFVEFGLDSSVVQACRDWTQKTKSIIALASLVCTPYSSVRLVLPYDVHISKGVHDALNAVQGQWNILCA